MTLEQLRIFAAVAERQHVTAAARALNLTQSAVSNAIAALEERHGVPLFDRVGRGIVLNRNGEAFLPEARAVLAQARIAEAALSDLGTLRRGALDLFASQTIASYWLPSRLAAFQRAYPGIAVSLRIGNTEAAAQAVLSGEADLGFVEGSIAHPALAARTVAEDRLLILTPPGHPWAARQASGAPLSAADLLAEPWLLREPGSGTRSSLEDGLRKAGCDLTALRVAMVLPSNEAILTAAQEGAGVTALSEHAARLAVEAGRLAALRDRLPVRHFQLLRHRQRYHSRAADIFTQAVDGSHIPAA